MTVDPADLCTCVMVSTANRLTYAGLRTLQCVATMLVQLVYAGRLALSRMATLRRLPSWRNLGLYLVTTSKHENVSEPQVRTWA